MGIRPVIRPVRHAVFLDRDGVLNRPILRGGKPYPPATPEELELIPEARESLERLKERGFLLLVVTNQPDVARGTQQRSAVEAIHRILASQLPVQDFFVCYHDDGDGCDCRKPLPGLLTRAAAQYGIDLAHSYLIGDRWRDVEAGARAGCRTAWIDYHYNEREPAAPPDVRATSLREAVDWILQDYNERV